MKDQSSSGESEFISLAISHTHLPLHYTDEQRPMPSDASADKEDKKNR